MKAPLIKAPEKWKLPPLADIRAVVATHSEETARRWRERFDDDPTRVYGESRDPQPFPRYRRRRQPKNLMTPREEEEIRREMMRRGLRRRGQTLEEDLFNDDDLYLDDEPYDGALAPAEPSKDDYLYSDDFENRNASDADKDSDDSEEPKLNQRGSIWACLGENTVSLTVWDESSGGEKHYYAGVAADASASWPAEGLNPNRLSQAGSARSRNSVAETSRATDARLSGKGFNAWGAPVSNRWSEVALEMAELTAPVNLSEDDVGYVPPDPEPVKPHFIKRFGDKYGLRIRAYFPLCCWVVSIVFYTAGLIQTTFPYFDVYEVGGTGRMQYFIFQACTIVPGSTTRVCEPRSLYPNYIPALSRVAKYMPGYSPLKLIFRSAQIQCIFMSTYILLWAFAGLWFVLFWIVFWPQLNGRPPPESMIIPDYSLRDIDYHAYLANATHITLQPDFRFTRKDIEKYLGDHTLELYYTVQGASYLAAILVLAIVLGFQKYFMTNNYYFNAWVSEAYFNDHPGPSATVWASKIGSGFGILYLSFSVLLPVIFFVTWDIFRHPMIC